MKNLDRAEEYPDNEDRSAYEIYFISYNHGCCAFIGPLFRLDNGDKGQYDRAIEDFNRAIAVDLNCAYAYANRGIVYGKKEQPDRAFSDFQKACDMGNENGCKALQVVLKGR